MKVLKYLVGALSSYYITCISVGQMLFLQGILNDPTETSLLHPRLLVPLAMLGINIALIVIDDLAVRHKAILSSATPIYNRICREIHDKIAHGFGDPTVKPAMRVSIHKAMRTPFRTVSLRNVGRYQHTAPLRLSRVSFSPGQGCAGMCYQSNMNHLIELDNVEKLSRWQYSKANAKKAGLPLYKALGLKVNSSWILSVPIPDKEERPWGVLTVDSTRDLQDSSKGTRSIEEVIERFRIVFHDREVD